MLLILQLDNKVDNERSQNANERSQTDQEENVYMEITDIDDDYLTPHAREASSGEYEAIEELRSSNSEIESIMKHFICRIVQNVSQVSHAVVCQ